MTKNIFILAFLFLSHFGNSQNLKLEEIMKGESFIGNQPTNGRWSLDGKKVYFEWNPKDELGPSTFYWQKGMSTPEKASPKEAVFSRLDFKTKPGSDLVYYLDNGSLFSYSIQSKTIKKLIQQSSKLSNLQLGAQAGVLFYEQNDNIFKYDTKAGTILQITNFSKGIKRDVKEDTESFLAVQQKELFQFIRDKE